MTDWVRSSKNAAYHKPAGNVTAVCKRIVPARYITDEATVHLMDEARYALVCKDCIAKEK